MKFKEYKKIINELMEVKEENRIKVFSPTHARTACLEYCCKDQEHFILLTLNVRNQIIGKHCITIGLVNRTQVHPREIFKQAILDSAVGIIAVHNHPSGDLLPSPDDDNITKVIKDSGNILGIHLLDHVIIGRNDGYFSYTENNRL
jgi:DNA repair protein RadC